MFVRYDSTLDVQYQIFAWLDSKIDRVWDSELSMLQSNQKASEETTSFGDFDVQQTDSKIYITYLAARGPRAKLE